MSSDCSCSAAPTPSTAGPTRCSATSSPSAPSAFPATGPEEHSVDFRLSEDQRDLRDAVRTLLAKAAGPEAVRAAMAGPLGRDERLWRQISHDLGLTGLAVPEEHGGAAATFAEVAVVLEELGAVLLPSPYLSTVVAVEVLKRSALAPRFLPLLAAGAPAAWADAEPGDRSWPPRLDSQATPDGARWRLNGGKAAV